MKAFVRGSVSRKKIWGGTARVAGFTIVETLIVLTVTGALFVAIAATLSGRQNAAEFTHAIQNIQARIQQTIEQVNAGFYPNNSDFQCSDTGGGKVNISGGSASQGTNDQCVLLGKALQFKVHGTNPEQYETYTIAGLRCADPQNGGDGCPDGSASPFHAANPTVVLASSAPGTLEYGLTTAWMKTGNTDIGAVAFLMEPGSLDSNSLNGYSNGNQQVDLIPIPTTSLDQSVPNTVTAIEQQNNGGLNDPGLPTAAPINPSTGVQICFQSAGTNQSGLITIGGTGRQLLVKLDIKDGTNCT